jgi:hypothetical protein
MKRYISDVDFELMSASTTIPLSLFELRNSRLFEDDRSSKMAFRMLCETALLSYKKFPPIGDLLERVVDCTSSSPCNLVCCPVCRSKRQSKAVKSNLEIFRNATNEDSYFLTLLLPMASDLDETSKTIKNHRKNMYYVFREYKKKFPNSNIDIVGAYEYDLKSINEYNMSSDRARKLFNQLGFEERKDESMWLPHLHAIVSPLQDDQVKTIRDLINVATFDTDKIPFSIELKRFREDKVVSENISEISKYLWKVRLQHADNIFLDNKDKKRSRYLSMFPVQDLYYLVSHIASQGSFKSLKFQTKI